MNIPANLKYSKDHEWVSVDGDVATIGITDYAQHSLGDVVVRQTCIILEKLEDAAIFLVHSVELRSAI